MSGNGKILDKVNYPEDLRKLSIEELKQLSGEIRSFLIEKIPKIGGHLASSLGMVELTLAIHYVYNTPEDKTVWDVGHQAYVHKMITGRKDKMETIRRLGGISGFLKMEESEYDCFGAGHATTSISAALGMAIARDRHKEDYKIVAIIGDGALTGGLSFEAMNHLGNCDTNMTIILNDNNMSISPNVGALSRYLDEIITNPVYRKIKNDIWNITEKLPGKNTIRKIFRETQHSIKKAITPGLHFEALGIQYFGPVDGHDIEELVRMLRRIEEIKGPKIIHVLSKKGKGMPEAENDPISYHGVSPSSSDGGKKNPNYLDVFGKTMNYLAETDDKVVAITAAMTEGTGLSHFREKFADRLYDVGIAEEHAVLLAAGMSTRGLKPFVAIYSTFLQRAFDQLVHDVALQKLPVVFCLDRAGLVGADGPTHHGNLDLGYLNIIPQMVIAAPANGSELRDLMYTALFYNDGPFAIRYPKERTPDDVDFSAKPQKITIGEWEKVSDGNRLAIIATGAMVDRTLKAKENLVSEKINPAIINARFIKPIDHKMLDEIEKKYKNILVIEENTVKNGLSTNIMDYFNGKNSKMKVFKMALPDSFTEHGTREQLLKIVGLAIDDIEENIKELY